MIDTIVKKVKGFLTSPVETFQKSKTDETSVVFTYFGVLLLINAILSAIVSVFAIDKMPLLAGIMGGVGVPVVVFIGTLIGGVVGTIIFAVWMHLWVYLLGGRKGIMQTLNALIYSGTPRLLLGWIPFIGFIFALWSLVLGVLGIRELQELSTNKAILVVAIAVIIPLIVIILLAAWFFTSYMMSSEIPAAPFNAVN